MFRETQEFVWARPLVNAMLTALKTVPAGALLTTPKIVVWTAGPAPTPDSAIADYTAATFHGYAAATVTLSGAVNLNTGKQCLVANVTFVATSGGTLNPETLLGYALTDGAAAYYGGEQFQSPVPISSVGDFLSLDLILPMPDAVDRS